MYGKVRLAAVSYEESLANELYLATYFFAQAIAKKIFIADANKP